jgi:hypothetical protein
MYWPGSTREGSARKALTTPQSMMGLVGKGTKSRSQSASNSGPRDLTSSGVRRSLAQTSGFSRISKISSTAGRSEEGSRTNSIPSKHRILLGGCFGEVFPSAQNAVEGFFGVERGFVGVED